MYSANPETGKLIEAPDDGHFYLSQGYVAIECGIKDISVHSINDHEIRIRDLELRS